MDILVTAVFLFLAYYTRMKTNNQSNNKISNKNNKINHHITNIIK
jgi:hypothetical protein